MDLVKPLNHDSLAHQKFGTNLEPRRWGILVAFSLYNAGVAMAWLAYGVTANASMQYFNIGTNDLLMLSDSVLYMSFALSYLGCWLIPKFFKFSLWTFTFLAAVSGWIKYIGPNYGLALISQILVGLATAPVFGFAAFLPDRWFSTQERFIVTTISLYSNYFGWAAGYLIPCLIVDGEADRTPINLFVQAVILTVPFILSLIFGKDRPDVPPSYSALVKLTDHSTFREEIKVLVKMPGFLLSSTMFGLVLGISYSISTVSGIFMASLSLSPVDQGIIGSAYVLVGMVSGFIVTFWLSRQKTPNYDLAIKILLTISLVSLTALGFLLMFFDNPSFVLILICNCLLGVGLIGFMPSAYSAIIESSFPVQESMSSNATAMLSQIFCVITGHLSTASFVGKGGFVLLAGLMLPCWIYGVFYYKTEYKKQNADNHHQEISDDLAKSVEDLDKLDKGTVKESSNRRNSSLFKIEAEHSRSRINSKTSLDEEKEHLY